MNASFLCFARKFLNNLMQALATPNV